MSRVLLAFFNAVQDKSNPTVVPCFYESFIKGLENNGNIVMAIHHNLFNIDFPQINEDLKNIIKSFNPDIAIIFNNSFFDLSNNFDFPIIIYEVDSAKYFSNKDILMSKSNRFKFIVSQTKSIENLVSTFRIKKNNILYCPFFTSVKNEKKDKAMDISFIGSRFLMHDRHGIFPWNRFMHYNPDQECKNTFISFINDLKNNPQNENDIIEKYKSSKFNIESITDCCDIVMCLSASKRELILSQISDLGLTIYGPKDWVVHNCSDMNIVLSYNNKKVYSLAHNQDIYNKSRIAININHYQAESGFSWRVCDIMASDAVLVTEYSNDFSILFSKCPIPTYKSRYEVRDICKKLLANKNMCEDIVLCSNEIIEKNFRFEHIIKKIEQFSNVNFMNKRINKNHRTFFIAI